MRRKLCASSSNHRRLLSLLRRGRAVRCSNCSLEPLSQWLRAEVNQEAKAREMQGLMKPADRKSPGLPVRPQTDRNQHAPAPRTAPVVAQAKNRWSNLPRPVTPKVYRPQPLPKVLQTKSATAQLAKAL